jgi:hypothetical protein
MQPFFSTQLANERVTTLRLQDGRPSRPRSEGWAPGASPSDRWVPRKRGRIHLPLIARGVAHLNDYDRRA